MDGEVDATSPFPDAKATPILDAQPRRAPGEAAAHRLQHDKIARFDAPVPYREVERQRHRCRRCIRVLVNRLRSEEHTSELQSLMRTSYAVFYFNKKKSDADMTLLHQS